MGALIKLILVCTILVELFYLTILVVLFVFFKSFENPTYMYTRIWDVQIK